MTLRIATLTSARLSLEPLSVGHAAEAAPVFADVELHEFIGGSPLSLDALADRYSRLEKGQSADGSQLWLNWMLRDADTGMLVGTVQATVEGIGKDAQATLAWVVGLPFQGRGYASEAARCVTEWLRARGVASMRAYVHPRNQASAAVARSIGLSTTVEVVDGECLWTDAGSE